MSASLKGSWSEQKFSTHPKMSSSFSGASQSAPNIPSKSESIKKKPIVYIDLDGGSFNFFRCQLIIGDLFQKSADQLRCDYQINSKEENRDENRIYKLLLHPSEEKTSGSGDSDQSKSSDIQLKSQEIDIYIHSFSNDKSVIDIYQKKETKEQKSKRFIFILEHYRDASSHEEVDAYNQRQLKIIDQIITTDLGIRKKKKIEK